MRRWENNIKIELKQIGCESVDWVNFAQYMVKWRIFVKTMDLWIQLKAGNILTTLVTVSFSRRTRLHGDGNTYLLTYSLHHAEHYLKS